MSTKAVFLTLFLLPRLLFAADAFVLEGVHIVPMDRARVLEDMTVVVEDGLISALGKRGRIVIPPEARKIDARGRYLLPGLFEMHVHLRERSALGLYLAHGFTNEAGVDLLIGTDSHSGLVPAGSSGLDEMDLFIEAGLNPFDALRAATVNAANVLKQLDESGTIAVGKRADLVLLDANPLDSLKTLRSPLGVMTHGRYYDRAELIALKP